MIRFENVTKTFPSGKTALNNISFRVEPGELTALVGPSGSGKTTLLKLLIKEINPTSGEIIVDEMKLNQLKPRDLTKLRQKIGSVFQDLKILDDRTVEENVGLILEIGRLDDLKISRRVDQVLNMVGLSGLSRMFPRQLSGGELQRVSLARAIAPNPPILFADEPTGNLDPATARQIAEILKKIHQAGTTIIVATHDSDVLDILSPRVLKLKQGELIP